MPIFFRSSKLRHAVVQGNTEEVDRLLVDCDYAQIRKYLFEFHSGNNTLLMMAASSRQSNMIVCLLSKLKPEDKVEIVMLQNPSGHTACHLAAMFGDFESFVCLVDVVHENIPQRLALLNLKDTDGTTILQNAVYNLDVIIIDILLRDLDLPTKLTLLQDEYTLGTFGTINSITGAFLPLLTRVDEDNDRLDRLEATIQVIFEGFPDEEKSVQIAASLFKCKGMIPRLLNSPHLNDVMKHLRDEELMLMLESDVNGRRLGVFTSLIRSNNIEAMEQLTRRLNNPAFWTQMIQSLQVEEGGMLLPDLIEMLGLFEMATLLRRAAALPDAEVIRDHQTTHLTGVHLSLSASALRLAGTYLDITEENKRLLHELSHKVYQLEDSEKEIISGIMKDSMTREALEQLKARIRPDIDAWVTTYPDDHVHRCAKRALDIIVKDGSFQSTDEAGEVVAVFVESRAHLTKADAFALVWVALHEEPSEDYPNTLEDKKRRLVQHLYEIMREYNLNDKNQEIDENAADHPACDPGAWNALIQVLQDLHPHVECDYLSSEMIQFKVMKYLLDVFDLAMIEGDLLEISEQFSIDFVLPEEVIRIVSPMIEERIVREHQEHMTEETQLRIRALIDHGLHYLNPHTSQVIAQRLNDAAALLRPVEALTVQYASLDLAGSADLAEEQPGAPRPE